MADKERTARPARGIVWGQDIQRPRAVNPPPDIIPYLQGLATGLNGFAARRRRSIEYWIEAFELDRESWQERAGGRRGLSWEKTLQQTLDRPDAQRGRDNGYMKPYNINKALTLELMMTCALFRLLSPTCARSNCKLKFGWPINFAPRGKPDITVDCDGFIIHVEVSARIDMDDEYFAGELKGTLNHMVRENVDWGLLVTEWDHRQARRSQAYKDFKTEREDDLEGRRLVILSLQEMAELGTTLAFDADFNSGKKRLRPVQVRKLFGALHKAQETMKPTATPGKGGKQKRTRKKNDETNLRDTWINTTTKLLGERPANGARQEGAG